MSFNGSGTYNLPAGQPVVTGTTISSTTHNTLASDLATALSLCVTKDGQQTITANIPMAGYKFTGLGDGTSASDSATMAQAQGGVSSTLTSVAGTNTITGSATPIPAYTVGQKFTFTPAVTNTGAVTLNISSLGAGAVRWAGAALTGGELVAGTPVTVLVTAATPVFEIINATQFPDSRALVVGATDATKKLRFEVDGFTTGTTRVVSFPDADLTINAIGAAAGAASDTAAGVIEIAVQSEMEAGSSTTLAVTPGRQHYHPSAAKGWAKANMAGGAESSYNVSSITDAGVGNATCNWATDFSSAAYAPHVQGWSDTTGFSVLLNSGTNAGATNAVFRNTGGTDTDPNYLIFIAFGDQA